jgi:acetyl esterase/lipase
MVSPIAASRPLFGPLSRLAGLPLVWLVACLLIGATLIDVGGAADDARPTEIMLAWREDPRPAADTPAGVEVPPGRRVSRRAQRRISRRRQPLDEMPVDEMQLEMPPASPAAAATLPVEAHPAVSLPPTAAVAASITTHRDHPYGHPAPGQPLHSRQRFDLYLPAGCNAGGMPLVVWIHGDTWRDGSKADCPVTWLAKEGYAVASIGYRLSDTAVFPAQLDDCREAIAEIERNAEVWGIDIDRVAVAGSGAGGHLAALVGLVNQPPAGGATATDRIGEIPFPRIAAVCAVAAPASLTTLGAEQDRAGSPASRLVGGPLPEFREAAQQASPIAHVSGDDPPVLILHGDSDGTVPPKQAVEFAAMLKAANVDTTLVILANVGHRPGLDLGTPGGQALLSFLDRVLGPGVRPARVPPP